MTDLKIFAGDFGFRARLEDGLAPKTCTAFLQHLPFKSRAVHIRWSGEGIWISLGDLDWCQV